MPRVPTYDAPQVELRALPGVRQSSVATPELLTVGTRQQMEGARSMLSAGTGLAGVATVMQERENADMLFRAETALKDEYLTYEADLRERKGQQAWGATKDTEKWFAEQEKKHSEILTNDTQRRLFGQSLTRMRQQAVGSVSAYEAGQRRLSLEESANASIVGSINQAARYAAETARLPAPTPEQDKTQIVEGADGQVTGIETPAVGVRANPLTGFKSDILKRVQVLTELNGWSPERRAAEEEKQLTNFHSQVIQNYATVNPSKAKAYYEANKAEIAGSSHEVITRTLKEGTLRETAQTFADDVQVRGLSMADALTEARKKYSGEEEVAATQEVKTRFAEADAALRQGQQRAGDAAWKVITAGGGRKQIPLDTWNSMAGEEQRQVLDYLDAKARRAAAPEGQDDLANLDTVERLIEQGDITSRADLAKYQPFFKPATLRTLSNKIDKRSAVPPADVRRVFEERKGERVNVNKMSDSDRNEWMAFQDYILSNVKETKRPEDIDQWADRWFMRGYGRDDSFMVNDPNTFGEARAKGRKDFVINTPEAARDGVDQALGLLERNGVAMPKNRALARDEFYTSTALDAQRWAGAHNTQATPELTAAYALLKRNNKPITPANVAYVMQQLKR